MLERGWPTWSDPRAQDQSERTVNDEMVTHDEGFAASTSIAVLIVGNDGVGRHHTPVAGRMLASPDDDYKVARTLAE